MIESERRVLTKKRRAYYGPTSGSLQRITSNELFATTILFLSYLGHRFSRRRRLRRLIWIDIFYFVQTFSLSNTFSSATFYSSSLSFAAVDCGCCVAFVRSIDHFAFRKNVYFLKQVLKIIHFIVSGCRKCTLLLSHHPADLPTYPPMQH